MHKITAFFACLILLGVLVACAGGTIYPAHLQVTPSTYASARLTPAPVTAPLVGDYITAITQRDGVDVIGAPAVIAPDSVGSLSLGQWLISFRKDGYFTAQGPNSNTSDQYEGLGQYSVAGNLLTISDVKCQEFNGLQAYTATYRWSLQGKVMQLSVVGKELCTIRKILLTSHPLVVTNQ